MHAGQRIPIHAPKSQGGFGSVIIGVLAGEARASAKAGETDKDSIGSAFRATTLVGDERLSEWRWGQWPARKEVVEAADTAAREVRLHALGAVAGALRCNRLR